MGIFDRMQQIRDSVAPWATVFEVPTSRSLIVCQRQANTSLKNLGIAPTISPQYLEVTPRPIIETVNPSLVERFQGVNGIDIELTDFQISGISKQYERSQLVGRLIYYIIDGQLVNGALVGGIECDKIPGLDLTEEATTWSLVVRRKNSRGG